MMKMSRFQGMRNEEVIEILVKEEVAKEIEKLSNDCIWKDYFIPTGEVEVKLNYKKKV